MPLSPEAARLEGVKADIDATDVEGPPRAVRIAVTIQWEGRDGRPLPPIRLVAWRYR
jgi:hypothetical protein